MTMASKEKSIQLNTGARMPMMAFGTLMERLNPDHDTTVEVLDTAFKSGYRHFDTAKIYGTEKMLGEVLSKHMRGGGIKRGNVFITTKLWRNSMRGDTVVPALREQLLDLGLDYVDLYLIHWPTALKTGPELLPKDENGEFILEAVDYLDTWRGMEECYKLGLAKAIGLSNFNSKQITRILDNSAVKPANLQVECHPFFRNDKLIKFCEERDISVMAYAPLAGFNPNYREEMKWPTIYSDEIIVKIAEKHNRTPAQIALRFQMQRNVGVAPKSSKEHRMKENFQALDFKLDPEDMELIKQCKQGCRLNAELKNHPYYPFNEEF